VSILKWLFQPAYLLLIIVLVALYVNREALFPEAVTGSQEAEVLIDKVDTLVARLRSDVEQPLPETLSPVQAGESATTQGDDTESAVVPVGDEIGQQPSQVVPLPELAPVVAEVPAAATPGADSPVDSEVASTTAEISTLLPEESQGPAPVDTPPESGLAASASTDEPPSFALQVEPTASAAPVPPLVIWHAARAAVWQGDLDGAVAHYRQLIAVQPDNFDAYGEMGNVLLAQANVTGAIEAYTAAARLIHQAGHLPMAYRLAGVVAEMDEEQGRALFSEFSSLQK
jgi:tetratricopeptide (TPR) repeat protein